MRTHEDWMKIALELAQKAAAEGEVPVGALILKNDEVIASAYNQREKNHSVFAHAEALAISQACEKLKSWRLIDCTLVTTLEPCVMCAGALLQSRISHVVYGASDPKGGSESLYQILSSEKNCHSLKLTGGVLADEAAQLLQNFFKARR